jgi:hypothetical protein
LALDVGGYAGRKIVFSTAAGQVKVRKLKTDAEQSYSLPTASSFQGARPRGAARAPFV